MFKIKYVILFFLFCCVSGTAVMGQESQLYKDFKNPPSAYRPIPFWHLNGHLATDSLKKQVTDAIKSGFGGVAVLPVTPGPQYPTNIIAPGMTPTYLSDEYFARYADILKAAKTNGGKVILYDDIDFPSGTAGGKLKDKYPGLTRKVLVKTDTLVSGAIDMILPKGILMATVAVNTENNERKDLATYIHNDKLAWTAPAGKWKVMLFTCQPADGVVDFMDQEAVKKFITLTYDEYAQRFSAYFGNVVQQTFFDDVGYVFMERGWTGAFNEKFKQLYGKDPAIYYPALWQDIGPETEAARAALFNTRAELLAEGFPKIVSAWDSIHGLKSSGHPPGNYEIQPVDMNFDIFKFYRYEHIPTMDAIFYHGHGREGYKLISSAAAVYDRPVVASETYGAFQEKDFSIKTLYGTAMEIFARGVNFLIPHGMWYNYKPEAVRIPPLVSPYSKKLATELKRYNDYAARACMMLTGGRQVAEIGIIYPIASLEGFYHFEAQDNKEVGKYVAQGTDYLKLSDLLTNDIHRDFTFIHPELFISERYNVGSKIISLKNKINAQNYRVIILPAGRVISYIALQKLKFFYDKGGKILFTGLLPSKSAEFGMDKKVTGIIKDIFGIDSENTMPDTESYKTNVNGGTAMFLPKTDADVLALALNKLDVNPDVIIENGVHPSSGNGAFSYIHKIRNKKNIYFFANSTNDTVSTYINLRGKLNPWLWDPLTGKKSKIVDVSFISVKGRPYTRVKLLLQPVTSVFIVE